MAASLGGVGISIACGSSGAFECTSDSQCVQGAVEGRCEPSGFCSFPDPDCPSGRRYGSFAGDGLGGACVSDTDAGTTTGLGSTTHDPSTSSDTGSMSGADATMGSDGDSSSGQLPAECGNGIPETGEACDDGNDEIGDGCNPDCVLGGTVLWSQTISGADDGFAEARGVALLGDDFVVAGTERTSTELDNVMLRRYTLDGDLVWAVDHDIAGQDDIAWDVAVSVGSVWVAGDHDEAMGNVITQRPQVSMFDTNGQHGADFVGEAGGARAVAASPDGVVATGFVGTSGTNAQMWVESFDPMGAGPGPLLSTSAQADAGIDIALTQRGTVYVCGLRGWSVSNNADLFLDRVENGAFVNLDTVPSEAYKGEGQAIGVAPNGDIVVGGYLTYDVPNAGAAARDAWLTRYAPDGETIWTVTYGSPDATYSDEVEGLVIADNGDIVTVGFVSDGEPTFSDLWARRYTPGGEVRWDARLDTASGDDVLRDVVIAANGQIVAVGSVEGTDGVLDAWVGVLSP